MNSVKNWALFSRKKTFKGKSAQHILIPWTWCVQSIKKCWALFSWKSFLLKSAQFSKKLICPVLKSAQKCPIKKSSALFKKVLSTFQRALYTYNVCVKRPRKVLITFCPKISERKNLKWVQTSVCSYNLTRPWPGTDWNNVIQYKSQMSWIKAKVVYPAYF